MDSKKVVIILGSSGQLGKEFSNSKNLKNNFSLVCLDRSRCDITNYEHVKKEIFKHSPSYLINCAAYTNVDGAELNYLEANSINNEAVENLAKLCNKKDTVLIHFSTDYVFEGNKEKPIKENDNKNPINAYGLTKHLGEEAIYKNCVKYFLFRVSWVYGSYGNNFPKKIIKSIVDNKDIDVVSDQLGSPTPTKLIVSIIEEIISDNDLSSLFGTYHISPNGSCSWFNIAQRIKNYYPSFSKEIKPIKSESLDLKAKRPKFSYLDNTYLKKTFKISIKNWDEYVDSFLEDKNFE